MTARDKTPDNPTTLDGPERLKALDIPRRIGELVNMVGDWLTKAQQWLRIARSWLSPGRLILLLGIAGFLLAAASELFDGAESTDWDAVREVGGALVVSAAVGWVFYAMEQAREDKREEHSEDLSREQKRHLLAVTLAVTESLSGVVLANHDLEGVVLAHRNLSKANLSGAVLRRADLTGIDLRGADLTDADLSEAELSGANLEGACLHRANLSNSLLHATRMVHVMALDASFVGAQIVGAEVALVDFRRADFTGAKLGILDVYRSDFEFATIDNADISSVRFLDSGIPEELFAAEDFARSDIRILEEELGACRFHDSTWSRTRLNNVDFSNTGTVGIWGLSPDQLDHVGWSVRNAPSWPADWSDEAGKAIQNRFVRGEW